MRNRKLYGMWSSAKGIIHDLQGYGTVGQPPAGDPKDLYVCIDTATTGVTHALLIAKYPSAYWVIDEWHYDGQTAGHLWQRTARSRQSSGSSSHT